MHRLEEDSFETFFRQHKHRIHYHIHDLDIKDPQNEFYVEGFCALFYFWKIKQARAGTISAGVDVDSIIRVYLIDLLDRKWF
ncbi:hypothetical protein KFZ56_15815 [Virgibacillus sp. NKC19-3]|uniref:hypothetical protein n=1 Tax=Virgibacillus saliphilus TaxID=2831674 RepID=UPI001C9B072D|nr:hypothetical protein [Virgibacillus sp. NKC19-3]MBY7144491.1 hypothetical protein [Virgibacillus sp. NKC19-3]